MGTESFIYVGTYTEPIRFGTGKILVGKGQGIYRYRLDGNHRSAGTAGNDDRRHQSLLSGLRSDAPLPLCGERTEDLQIARPEPSVLSPSIRFSGALEFLNRQ